MTKRWAVAVLALVVSTTCSARDEPSDVPVEEVESEPTLVDLGELATQDETDRVVTDLQRGIGRLYEQPTLIRIDLDEEGQVGVGTARVDRQRILLESEIVSPTRRGEITRRNVIVDQRFFLKSTTGPAAEAALDFTELRLDPTGLEILDEVYTAFGRVGPSLDRWVELLENVPFSVTTRTDDGRVEHRVTLDPRMIFEFYRESGLERVGGGVPAEATSMVFAFVEDVLVSFVAGGTHFHDGEALRVDSTVTYELIEPFEVHVPPVQE